MERTFTYTAASTPQQRQEIINAVRSIAEIPQTANVEEGGRFVLHAQATAEQLRIADWIFHQLDSTTPADAYFENRMEAPRDPAVRVYFMARCKSPKALEQLVNTIRSISEVQRVVAYSSRFAIVLRTNDEQMKVAEWMIQELDRDAPQARGVVHETRFPIQGPVPTPAVQAYYVGPTSPSDLQKVVSDLRNSTSAQRVVAFPAANAIIFRGTDAQAVAASKIVAQVTGTK